MFSVPFNFQNSLIVRFHLAFVKHCMHSTHTFSINPQKYRLETFLTKVITDQPVLHRINHQRSPHNACWLDLCQTCTDIMYMWPTVTSRD